MAIQIPQGDAANFQSFLDAFVAELQSSGVATSQELAAFNQEIAGYRNDNNATNIRFGILTTAKAATIQKKDDYVAARVAQTAANTDYSVYKNYKTARRAALVVSLRTFYTRIHAV